MSAYYMLPNNDITTLLGVYEYYNYDIKGNHPYKWVTPDMCREFIRDLLGSDWGYCPYEYSVHDVEAKLKLTKANASGWLHACQYYELATENGDGIWKIKEA